MSKYLPCGEQNKIIKRKLDESALDMAEHHVTDSGEHFFTFHSTRGYSIDEVLDLANWLKHQCKEIGK